MSWFDRFFDGGYDIDPFDDEVTDGDLSQGFDMLEGVGYDAFEASDMLDELVMSGASLSDFDEVLDGVYEFAGSGDVSTDLPDDMLPPDWVVSEYDDPEDWLQGYHDLEPLG